MDKKRQNALEEHVLKLNDKRRTTKEGLRGVRMRTVGEVGPPLALVALAVLVLQDAVALLRVVLLRRERGEWGRKETVLEVE